MHAPVYVILTTYHRTELALKTIEGVKTRLGYDNIGWVITDDTTGGDHLKILAEAVGPTYPTYLYDNQQHLGVGHNMNYALHHVFDTLGFDLVLLLEDDWYLDKPLDLVPFVDLLMNNERIGMIRLGYLSAGLQANLTSEQNKLWWEFIHNGYQYTFAGHASLRHRRFHAAYGFYAEGLSPGQTELDMCAKFNAKPDGPSIVFPAEYTHWGVFGHIGTQSLANISPGA